jgi:hypothetical protein
MQMLSKRDQWLTRLYREGALNQEVLQNNANTKTASFTTTAAMEGSEITFSVSVIASDDAKFSGRSSGFKGVTDSSVFS